MEFKFDTILIPGIINVLPDALSRLYPVPIRKANSSSEPTLLGICLQPEAASLLVTPPEENRCSILREAHSFGHLGAIAVVNRVKECGYFWPSLMKDATDHVASCASCQRFSIKRVGFHPLQPIQSDYPMRHVAVDLAGPFVETSRGNIYLLILICLFTKFVFLRALCNKSAETVATVLFYIFCEVEFPMIIQSDNGSEFVNSILSALCSLINVAHRLVTLYNPRANGEA